MCRNIKTLFNFDPPVTDDEVQAASLQFVRKITGFNKPSKSNELRSWLRWMKSPQSQNVCSVLWKQPLHRKTAKKKRPKPKLAPPSALEPRKPRISAHIGR